MKNITTLSWAVLLLSTAIILPSCQKDETLTTDGSAKSLVENITKSQNGNVFYGPTVPIGHGVARAWVAENPGGDPVAVGINLSEKALEGLPSTPQAFVLYFPNRGATDFYTHVLLDWNPYGHEPPGVYDTPHFDFHFYTIPVEDRLAIGPDDTLGFAAEPAPQYIPPVYLHTPGGVPQMGAHWVDLLAPEFNGGEFTRTFIWGSFDGHFIFWEPMVTKAFLESHPSEVVPVRQPQSYEREGWYASDYLVEYTTRPNQYCVALVNLVYHPGE